MAEYRILELRLLDDPQVAARSEMEDEGLAELAASIKALGVLAPLRVVAVDGGRFEVVAGHRRKLAAEMAGLAQVPCYVEEPDAPLDAVKIHENVLREELHPVDEAVFYGHLYERMGQDIERVAEAIRRPVDYVSRRLQLLAGPEAVRVALRANAITLGVAEELNRLVKPEDVSWYLEHATRGGVNVATMRTWRREANARAELERAAGAASSPAADVGQGPGTGAPAGPSMAGLALPHELSASTELRECFFCRERREEWQGIRLYVCRPCADTHVAPIVLQDQQHGHVRT